MNYDLNFWIGILGLLSTLIFGFLSIYIFKVRLYSGKIAFIQEQVLGLFDSIVKNFHEIKITYDNENINQQIVLLKGALINNGSIDIKEDMVEERLCLVLPVSFKWLSAKIIDSSIGSKVHFELVDNKIFVNLGLFRINEFIRFEALANISTDKNNGPAAEIFTENLNFEHRIAETSKVEKVEIKNESYFYKNRNMVLYLFITQLTLFLILGSIYYGTEIRKLAFDLSYNQMQDSIAIAELKSVLENLPLNELEAQSRYNNIVRNNSITIYTLLGIILFSCYLISELLYTFQFRKAKKLRKLLNLEK